MSASSLAVGRRASEVVAERDEGRVAARVVLATGTALIVGALVLLVLVEAATVPDAGRPGAARMLVRIGSGAPVLVLGALLLARLPRHPLGWLLGTTGLGMALGAAASEYAIYSHYVHRLPAGV
jgi:hypothetical protein